MICVNQRRQKKLKPSRRSTSHFYRMNDRFVVSTRIFFLFASSFPSNRNSVDFISLIILLIVLFACTYFMRDLNSNIEDNPIDCYFPKSISISTHCESFFIF